MRCVHELHEDGDILLEVDVGGQLVEVQLNPIETREFDLINCKKVKLNPIQARECSLYTVNGKKSSLYARESSLILQYCIQARESNLILYKQESPN